MPVGEGIIVFIAILPIEIKLYILVFTDFKGVDRFAISKRKRRIVDHSFIDGLHLAYMVAIADSICVKSLKLAHIGACTENSLAENLTQTVGKIVISRLQGFRCNGYNISSVQLRNGFLPSGHLVNFVNDAGNLIIVHSIGGH